MDLTKNHKNIEYIVSNLKEDNNNKKEITRKMNKLN